MMLPGSGVCARSPGGAKHRVTTTVTTVVDVVPDASGRVDWTQGEISAKGIGVRPKGMDEPQARVAAREAAIVIAERNLTKIVHGIHIESETTVRQAVLEDDEIHRRVVGFIRGARMLRERELQDGSYEVVMGLPMYGKRSSLAASVNLGHRASPSPAPPEPEAEAESEPPAASAEPAVGPASPAAPVEPVAAPSASSPTIEPAVAGISRPFTGLLVDCRGLGIQRCMSPKILDDSGQEVWGTVKVDPDLVNEKGILGYYKSVEQAKAMGRVGSNPLVVKAAGKREVRPKFADPVVSQADAARIKAEDARSSFLDRLAVGFLVD